MKVYEEELDLRSTSRLVKAFVLLTLLILSGCELTPQTSDPLNDTKWILRSLYGRPPLDGTIVTLEFSKGYVRGSSGCNDYFAAGDPNKKYRISGDGNLTIPSFAMTLVLCFPEEIMEQEDAYVKALRNVTEYRLTKGQLELKDGRGDTILVFANQSLVALPYLVCTVFVGGIAIYLWWFLLTNRPVQNYS